MWEGLLIILFLKLLASFQKNKKRKEKTRNYWFIIPFMKLEWSDSTYAAGGGGARHDQITSIGK